MTVCDGVLQEFRARVQLYSLWDRKLAPQTRFFGAAALINTALVDLWAHRAARLLVSDPTIEFLSKTGRLLESLNLTLADRIRNGKVDTRDLDNFMVVTEQGAVERELQTLHEADAASRATVVAQLSRLLDLAEYVFCGKVYAKAFASVRTELQRPLDFSSKEDRVRIGCSLIHHLRMVVSVRNRLDSYTAATKE